MVLAAIGSLSLSPRPFLQQKSYIKMQPYFGLRGATLNRAIIWLVVSPAFLCYGYNQGVMGGLLTLEAFANTFPQMDTLTTEGAQQHYNSTIQGTFWLSQDLSIEP